MTQRVYYEIQLVPPDRAGTWSYTVTVSRGSDRWTSAPAPLAATDKDAASAEARAAASRLIEALS